MVTAFAGKGTFYTNFTSQGNLMQDLQQDFREGTFPCKSPALAKFVARLIYGMTLKIYIIVTQIK